MRQKSNKPLYAHGFEKRWNQIITTYEGTSTAYRYILMF